MKLRSVRAASVSVTQSFGFDAKTGAVVESEDMDRKTIPPLEELCRRVSEAKDEPALRAALDEVTAFLTAKRKQRE